jgi:hypothetical protein
MSDLSKEFFERELSPAEEEALSEQLELSDEACAAFAAEAEADYRKSGFAAPESAQPKRWHWMAGGAVLALGLAWAAWPTSQAPKVLNAAVDDQAFQEQVQAPAPRRAVPAPLQEASPRMALDRLDVSREGSGFVLSVHTSAPGTGRLQLMDLQGQVLRSLFSGPLQTGTWAFRWDGAGADGRALTPGQYRLAWVRGDQSVGKTVQVEAR